MSNEWEAIAEALRAELQEYGMLMCLFDEQQGAILRCETREASLLQVEIARHLSVIAGCRREREKQVAECARRQGLSADASLQSLAGSLNEPVGLLFDALTDEINRMLSRARRRARQNQLLLARTVESMQGLLQVLEPGPQHSMLQGDWQAMPGCG